MPSLPLALLAALSLSSYSQARSPVEAYHQALRRGIITQDKLADSYDFVIAGGGSAGLVLASRLSEDPNVTVLVLEAGLSGDDVADRVARPGYTYYQSLTGTDYDWSYQTTAQPGTNGRQHTWPRGKLLGGSSAVNGLYWVRPSKTEVDAIAELNNGDPDAAKWWTWDAFLPAMKKSETLDIPTDAIKTQAHIEYNTESYGNSGPTHIGYPGITFDMVGEWHTALGKVGVPTNADPAGGNNVGSFVSTSNIGSSNWTRSTSRTSYINPLPPRTNLAILPKAQVTRIVWADGDGDLVAQAVEYASASGAAKKTVKVNKEVILSAGAIGSPQILQLSGVGPKDVLDKAGVKSKLELPGVGSHLQDHLAWGLTWKTDAQTSATIRASGSKQSTTNIFLSYVNSATAYVDLKTLVGDFATEFISDTKAQYAQVAKTVPGQDPTVLAGHKTIYDMIIDKFWGSQQVGQVEILLTMASPNAINVQSAIQHPLSFGRVAINSADAFQYPSVNPNYFAHPSDNIMMREGLKLARKVGQAYDDFGTETSPGAKVNSDGAWDAVIPDGVSTEFHPSSTNAMLPRNLGGVVDPRLRVYGTTNVRVADSSVFPFGMSCHLNGPTIGLAEQASNIIKAQYAAPAPSSSPSGNGNNVQQTQGEGDGGNGALSVASLSSKWTLAALLLTTTTFAML